MYDVVTSDDMFSGLTEIYVIMYKVYFGDERYIAGINGASLIRIFLLILKNQCVKLISFPFCCMDREALCQNYWGKWTV